MQVDIVNPNSIINLAIAKGAKLYANVSGGKDGQAMTAELLQAGFPIEGLLHMDLGRAEWAESIIQCKKLRDLYKITLFVRKRSDGLGLIEVMQNRMVKLQGTGKPFWPSSAARYCTSDTKRSVANKFYTSTGHKFIISCEGIRASESKKRAKKQPLSIREQGTSTYYDGMTVEEAIENFNPKYRLTLNYYPIFNYSIEDVWNSCGNTGQQLEQFREEYKRTGIVNPAWNFHPAYVYGNDRVSCVICVLASESDTANGARHRPELLYEYIEMENQGGCTFKDGFSLKSLLITNE